MPRTLDSPVHTPLDTHRTTLTPYEEATEWRELWQACVAVLDRNPHVRPTAPMWSPILRRVRIPQTAVDVADVHYHLD